MQGMHLTWFSFTLPITFIVSCLGRTLVFMLLFGILDARQNLFSVAILYQFTKIALTTQGCLFLGHFNTTVICDFHSLLKDVWLLVFNIMQ